MPSVPTDRHFAAYPLTAAQRGLWFAQRLDPDSPAYNVAEYVEVRGELDVRALRRAVRHVEEETEALRLTFWEQDGVPWQRVWAQPRIEVPVVDVSAHADPRAEAVRRMEAELARPADLARGPLARMALYRLADGHHLFHQQVHHLAVDGYGAVLALARIAEVYTLLVTAPDEPVPVRPAPLGPVLEDEDAYRAGGQHAADREFWSGYLDGAPAPAGLAAGAPGGPAHRVRAVRRHLGADEAARLRAAAKSAGVAWPAFLMAALGVCLHRERGLGEVVLGLPVTARRTPAARTTPAMLSNVLPMRLAISPADRVADVAKRASAEARKVLRHQRYPSQELRSDRGLGVGEAQSGPAVNVLAFDDALHFGPHPATLHNLSVGPVEDLVVAVHASYGDGGLRVDLLADPDRYGEAELARHHGAFCRLLEAFAEDPERPVGALPVVPAPEHARLIGLGTGAPASAGPLPTLPEQFAAQAARTPYATAVVGGGERLTFAELDTRVRALSAELTARGARPGERVAVGLERSADLVTALLAVLRSGAAYLPVDPSYPADRLAYMLQDAAPVALVARPGTAVPHDGLELVDPGAVPPAGAGGTEPSPPEPHDAAYVIYTSGSTGRPKGVVVEHRSLANLAEHHRREAHALAEASLGRRLRVALTAATSFDASWDPILWMTAGHELHLADDTTRRDPEALTAFLTEERIDAVETTPSYLRQLLAAGLLTGPGHHPRVLALGGEAVDDSLWAELSAHDDLIVLNYYGPTETTVDAVTARVTGTAPTIGRPVAGARAYILDSALHPMPLGTPGELYLSGEGVARGYAGRPGLTARRFLPDPFGPPGARMYRTGDLARWRADGTLEFLGRTDDQVKIRGHRVETGEVEAALRALPGIADAAVALTGPAEGPRRLAAYLVPGPGGTDPAEVRDLLAAALPDHLVPAAYAVLDRLPLTPNGKLDTARLPEAETPRSAGGAPRTPDEARMCAEFAACLGLGEVGRDDDFFRLGGHSLLATRLIGRVREAFGAEVAIRALFDHPTPAGLLTALDRAAPPRPPVRAVRPRPARVPLSPAQRRLWLLERMGGAGTAYHLPVGLRLTGPLDQEALAAALGDVVERHESLRTVVAEDADGPHQVVRDQARVPLAVAPLPRGGSPEPDPEPFALDREPPLRARLFTDGDQDHLLVLTFHHIAADGWSMVPLLRDLTDAYAARRAGRTPELAPLSVQYADYALWQHGLLGGPGEPTDLAARQLAHWTAALDGAPTESTLPGDRARPAQPSGRGGAVPLTVPAATHRAVAARAAASGTSPFMVLHAALAALMSRLGAGSDLVIGTPVAGRPDEALTDLVGFFVNTLALRTDTSGDPDLTTLLARVREADLAALAHQELPFERVVEAVRPPRAPARHPLFQVMLALNNAPAPRAALDGLTVRQDTAAGRGGAKFDLTWDLTERHTADGTPAGISGELEYSEDLFDRATAERFAAHFAALLTALLDHPGTPFTDLPFLTPRERAAALDESGPAPSAAAPGRTLTEVLAARTDAAPGRTAVVDATGRLTFGQLQDRAERLARRLAACGVRPGDRIAVALPRSAGYLAALLGVLRAGAVHVPLDTTHPAARNALILRTADPRLVLTTVATDEAVPATGHRRLTLADDPADWPATGPLPAPPRPGDAAYVLYTSGSTGRPKGVVVDHRALANLYADHREHLIGPAEAANNGRPLRVALTAALTFDASWDPILWMAAGHELHLVEDAVRRDPEALTAHLHTHAIDVVETTPSFLEQLRVCGLFAPGRPRPRVLALGGEAVNETLWEELGALTDVSAWNLYGPTEATVDAVTAPITAGTRPHLGRAVTGARARVLDARLTPAAPGTTGELYLTGPGLALGYEQAPAATADRFLPDPYGPPGSRMYRTGDLVRRRAGRLEYLGRADGQAKVRGFRVETGEVEAALLRHPGVAQAAATVRPGPDGTGRLLAWAVPVEGQRLAGRDLRAHAATRLPSYMVPATVVPVAALPLTVHGKTDFAALPDAPGPQAPAEEGTAVPRSAREEILCALFAECLGQPHVSRDDDFFDLGGHSLLALGLIGRVRSAFGVELSVRTLFDATTPAALAARLDDAGTARPALRRAERPAHPPLSPAQRRLWFLHGLDPADAAYHIPVAVRLDGRLDHAALRAALADVTARHESLRTRVQDHEGEPYQAVLDPGDARPALPVTAVTEAEVEGALREAAAHPFDLAADLPLRAELFALGAERHVLLVTVHHIAADGWSMGPLAEDLAGAYAARTAGRVPQWAPLPVQYTDYTLWQAALLGDPGDAGSLGGRQLAYWKEQLAGAPDEVPLPADRPRPARSTGRGGTVELALPPATTEAVTRLARATGTSPFMVLHAALAALLTRTGAGDDLTVGTPVAGRTDEALHPLVGFFVNTLPLRVRTDGDPTFRALLARVKETDLAAYAHQDIPFERLVEEVRPARSLNRHPLFQTMLTLNNTRPPRLDLPRLAATLDGVASGGAKFDLSFSLREEDGALTGTLEYSRDRFDPGTARRVAAWFAHLTAAATAGPDTPVRELPLHDAAEDARLLALGRGKAGAPVAHTVLDRFAETCARSRSGDLAVTAPDGSLSFPELDARSDHLAALLATTGVVPGDRVAVLLPRSTDSVAALLAVLKAGAVHVPLDTAMPEARLAAVLADARPRLTLATTTTADQLPTDHPRLLLGQAPLPAPAHTGARPTADDPAYLLHTSGSTGTPKGVLVGHRSLARLLDHHRRHLFAPAVRATGRPRLAVALTAALTFDASWDPVLWLLDGHHLHLLDDLTRRDPEALVDAVRTHRLDVLETTPSHTAHLLDAGLLADGAHHPAVLALGGEAVPPTLWTRLREAPATRCLNLYGPTEATVDTLTADLADTPGPVLGTPVTGTRALVLDAALRPTPPGVTGDLHLAGDSLALGYHGRPAETAARFVPDPYGPPGSRMYRTGDRAVRGADGTLRFAGRADGQVKIRGFRVETGEVAAVLETHPEITHAAVVPHDDPEAGTTLTAHLVPAPGTTPAPEDVRAHATRHLPAYMVPTHWTTLERIPLTPHGKLDTAALPAPRALTAPTGGRVPRTPREDVLCTLFAEALGAERVTIDDDFFALGGHSLLATRLIGRVRATLGTDLSIRTLFEAPTVAALADRLDSATNNNSLATLLPLRTTGSHPPLFCIHPAGGLAWPYAGLLPHLHPDQPLYGLQTPNLDGTAPFPETIEAMAAAYVAELRTVQPHGPYRLLGWSFGGNVVQEIAVQLQEAGEEVALLAILDAFPVAPLDDLDSASRDTVFRALLDNLGVVADAGEAGGGGAVDAAAVREEFRRAGSPLGALEPATIDAMVDNFAGQARLMRRHTPRTFHGPALFFTATVGRPADAFPHSLWDPYLTGPLHNTDVPYAHAQLMSPDARALVGPVLAEALAALDGAGRGPDGSPASP
ncbi:amino acid adenylation domain-containing protein [Streptomyces sp. NPDC058373]|uniref:amino acid adenylation domain-containing protein n=1 Tax=Streptomyces sp. NPDC058373 TaxID=3346465 RepID=UPI003651B120